MTAGLPKVIIMSSRQPHITLFLYDNIQDNLLGGLHMKKVLGLTLALAILLSLSVPFVYAEDETLEIVIETVEEANEKIDELIAEAIEETEDKTNKEIDNIIEELINDTNRMSEETINESAELGYEVVCEWIEVLIGGRIILIDPLRIVGF